MGLLQLMAHQYMAIDGAGADGSAEGAGGGEPGQSNAHSGDGACIYKLVVSTALLLARVPATKYVFRHRVVNER